MHLVGWGLKTVYMPFPLMVINLGSWRGGIYNVFLPFSLLEYRNMLFFSWKINFQFIRHQRNCSLGFLKHRILDHVKHFRIIFEKGFFKLHLWSWAWSTVLSGGAQKQNLPLPGIHWRGPRRRVSFRVGVRNACEWHGCSIGDSRIIIIINNHHTGVFQLSWIF